MELDSRFALRCEGLPNLAAARPCHQFPLLEYKDRRHLPRSGSIPDRIHQSFRKCCGEAIGTPPIRTTSPDVYKLKADRTVLVQSDKALRATSIHAGFPIYGENWSAVFRLRTRSSVRPRPHPNCGRGNLPCARECPGDTTYRGSE